MSDQHAFHAAMKADHKDATSRAVYADWLEEHGNPKHAARLRWWANALQHLSTLRDKGPANPPSEYDSEAGLPEWAHRLVWADGVRNALSKPPAGAAWGPAVPLKAAADAAEMHALGLSTFHEDEAARDALRAAGLSGMEHEVGRNLLRGDVKTSPWHPVRDLSQIIGRGHEHRVNHMQNAAHIAEYAKKNPPPSHAPTGPVQLARPIGWMKDKVAAWLGKPVARDPRDGIVHAHAKDPTAVYAEKNAVAQALRLLGAPDHMSRVDRYTNHVARFVKENPGHDAVKKYVDAAKVAGGTAGPELTEAVKPLVGVANLLLSAHGLDERFKRPEPEGKRAAFEHATSAPAPEPVAETVGGPQFELVDDAHEEPKEDRHTAIMRMMKDVLAGKASRDDIVQHLITTHGAPHRKAALASIRAALLRAQVLHEKAKNAGPTKLAALKPGAKPGLQHLKGEAYKDPYTQKSVKAHSLIADTALAYHLRQIGQEHPELAADAERALAWTAHSSNPDADPFAHLGRKLAKAKSRFADHYNWGKMEDGLLRDAWMQSFVKKHVGPVQGLSDRQLWERVNRQFGNDRHPQAEEFWKRFDKEAAHRGWSRDEAKESIHRIADRHLDRDYLSAERAEKTDYKPLHWQGVLGAAPSEQHAKFAREDCTNG